MLASETFSEADDTGMGGRKKLPAVQVGDPFTEKVLIECCLELFAAGLVVGIQDLGGAGLSCATSELASAGDGGMRIELDRVPLRATGMTPAEVLPSESQERMCAVITPGNAGIGENAGVVEIGDGWAVTCKIESHNLPSYVEPYQGAATGVGGIVRDIMAMGARPIAVADPLRFGPADAPDTARCGPALLRVVCSPWPGFS